MSALERQLECVMNVSEGRDRQVIDALSRAIESVPDAYLLDVGSDPDHHRTVLSFLGDLDSCPEAAFRAIGVAVERIDLRRHRGVHPRVGAADVVPFVPLKNLTIEACVSAVRVFAVRVAEQYGLPVYLYGSAARIARRSDLAVIRKGGLDGLQFRMETDPDWTPDYGPCRMHETAGACVIGVRPPLVAFNVFLDTEDVDVARRIASRVRERDGGLKAVKALGLYLPHRKRAQVSMNLVDYRVTPPRKAFEQVRKEAVDLGAAVHSSELIGLIPRAALPEGLEQELRLENYSPDRILENRIQSVLRRAAAKSNRRREVGDRERRRI